MKHFTLVGRIPCHENVVFSTEAVSVTQAVSQFKKELHEGMSEKELSELKEVQGSTVYLDHIFESETKITRRDTDYGPPPPP